MITFLRPLVFLTIIVSLGFGSMATADAHRGDQSYLYLDFGETLAARLQMPFPDVYQGLGIDIGGTEDEIAEIINDNAQTLRDYAADHVELGSGTATWTMTPGEVAQVEDINYVEVVFAVDIGGPIPDEIRVTLDPFFDEIEDRDALMLVGNDWQRGVVDSEDTQLVVLTPDSRTQTVTLGDSSQWKNFRASFGLGVDHIRTGPDHMLFIVALVLPSVLIWRSGWKPADGFLSTLWRITKVMTMFTLAHSITFTLTGLDLVPAPGPKVTETIIALSIAATALHSLRPVIANREWLIALVFGLFHGFGFASLVQDLDVNNRTRLVSLLGRNAGIEIGQLFVVLLCFTALFLLRSTRYYRPFFMTGNVVLIIVSIGWAIERLFGGRQITSSVVDEITEFPRVLLFVAVGTAICAWLYLHERAQDRLIPTVGRSNAPEPERELQPA